MNISVITITKVESESDFSKLLDTLKSFSETVSQDRYTEYIVVCAGKQNLSIPDEIKNKIKNLKIIYTQRANWSLQRNVGLDNANGDFILFVDDGMRFERGWIEKLISTYIEKKDAVAVSGVVLPDISKTIFGKAQGILNHPGGGYKLLKDKIYEIEYFHTGICLARKDILCKVRFDENLKFGCEDMDISIRIKKMFPEAKFYLNPFAISYHHTRDNLTEICKWMLRYGKGRAVIYKKHGIEMTGFFIHKFILFLALSGILSLVLSPTLFPSMLVLFYTFYLFRLSEYRKFADMITFLVLPLVFWIMNISFDIGRIYVLYSPKKFI